MQESFMTYYNKSMREKASKITFWITHAFFFLGLMLVIASGGVDSQQTQIDVPLVITGAVLYPIGAIIFETYRIYSKYKNVPR